MFINLKNTYFRISIYSVFILSASLCSVPEPEGARAVYQGRPISSYSTCSTWGLHRKECLCCLLGLMASAILVIHLGHLYKREFRRWMASIRLDPVRPGRRRVVVTVECVKALHQWRYSSFLTPMGAVLSRKVVTMEVRLSG